MSELLKKKADLLALAVDREKEAALLEEMRSIYPGDITGEIGRDAEALRETAAALRARAQPSPDEGGEHE